MTELAEVCLALTLSLRPYYNPVREIVNAILQMRTGEITQLVTQVVLEYKAPTVLWGSCDLASLFHH